jgi:hypothetical protein
MAALYSEMFAGVQRGILEHLGFRCGTCPVATATAMACITPDVCLYQWSRLATLLGFLALRPNICFSNSADFAIRIAACSINLTAVSRSFSASRRICSEVDLSGN